MDLVKRKGSVDHTIIFYDLNNLQNPSVGVILDDSIMDRRQDIGIYQFVRSEPLRAWAGIVDHGMGQKQFINFLKSRPAAEVAGYEALIANVSNVPIDLQIAGDFTIEDVNNVSFVFKTKQGEGSASLPKTIVAKMPLLNEGHAEFEVEMELETKLPRSENEKLVFTVSCPRFEQYLREALQVEVDRLKQDLPDHLILAGQMGKLG